MEAALSSASSMRRANAPYPHRRYYWRNCDRILKRIKLPTLAQIEQYINDLPVVGRLLHWAKTKSLPGFFTVPIYDVVIFVWHEIQRFDLFTRANSIAFSFFLSLFPSLLTLFTLAPFILDILAYVSPQFANFNDTLYEEIQRIMPGEAGNILFDFVQEITNEPQVGLISFGFILAIYFSSNGMLAMMQSFEKSYPNTFRKRTAVRKRLVAVMLTGLLGILLTSSVLFIIMGNIIIGWITSIVNWSLLATVAIDLVRWLAILLLFYFTIALLYRYGAATYRRFRIFSPGTTLATVLCILSSIAFSFYVDKFNRYDAYAKFYGSIGTIIIVMLWIQLNSLILLIGFELNASIAVNRDLKEQIKEED